MRTEGSTERSVRTEAEPNDNRSTPNIFDTESSLEGELSREDVDVLQVTDPVDHGYFVVEARDSAAAIDVFVREGPVRWMLGEVSDGQPLRLAPDELGDDSMISLEGLGRWSFVYESDERTDSGALDEQKEVAHQGIGETCDAPNVTNGREAQWMTSNEEASSTLCLDGEGELTLPADWRGEHLEFSGQVLTEGQLITRISGQGALVGTTMNQEEDVTIDVVRLTAENTPTIEFEASEPLTFRVRMKPLEDVTSADIEPNDRPVGATTIERGDEAHTGTIHIGDTADWLEFPWLEAEEAVNLSLAPMQLSGARLRWKTLDGWEETPPNEDGEGLHVCALQREPDSTSFKMGVVVEDVREKPLEWAMTIKSLDTASFESEPNDERLLSMEVPRVDGRDEVDGSSVVFAVPGREFRTSLKGYVGQRGDERDVYPFRVGGLSRDGEPVNVEVAVHPPSRADLKLSLVDSDGVAIARSLDGGMGAEESVRATLPTGLYHAVVELDDGEACAGPYEVVVRGDTVSGDRSPKGAETSTDRGSESSEDDYVEGESDNPLSNQGDIAPPPLERPGAD